MKWLAYAAAASVALLLVVLFANALPDAAARAREGYKRGAESACDGLNPTPRNPVLGMLPVKAPNFTLKDYQGRDVSLESLRGNVVLLNFWATWCKTCVVEMPSMERLVDRYKGKPFKLLAVSVDDDWPSIRKFFANGTNLDVVLDTARAVPKQYGTEKFPETFLIDKDGTVRYYIVSDRDWTSPDVNGCLDAMLD
jgi:peroxiredoxin